jgi:hypothetical protein
MRKLFIYNANLMSANGSWNAPKIRCHGRNQGTLMPVTDNIEIENTKRQLQALSKILLGMFGLSFFFGGAFIHFVHPQTGRLRAEIEAQIISVLIVALHVTAIVVADRIGWGKVDPNGPKSLSEALRK